jgi:predicted nuclease of restriction endonuclease-like (RecB) superfamily
MTSLRFQFGEQCPRSKLKYAENKDDKNYFINLFTKISYSHFNALIKIESESKRKFYELLVIKNTLSVRELERQIATLTFERVGMSQNTELAINELANKITPITPNDAVKSVYFFDFLNLPNHHLIEETELEDALINHLEKFIIELGNGFCFEARQKRVLIDDEYYFIDLVFYHRILKCHILIDLKVDKFKHEHLSQLNSYVSFYNDQVKQKDDSKTIGILLCTEKGEKMVEYALAGMEEKLFVSKYLIALPSKEVLSDFIQKEIKNL